MMLTLVGAMVATPLLATDLKLCVQAPVDFDANTAKAFVDELTVIARSSGYSLYVLKQTNDCQDIRLTIKSMSKTEISALGSTQMKAGRSLPDIEIYASSIATMVQSKLPGVVGRGMARVAAQEITRYITKTNSQPVTAARLMVRDNQSFLIPATAPTLALSPIRR